MSRTSFDVTSKVMCYFRFDRRALYIATEVGPYNADILCILNEKLVEIEVKISLQDFRNDFKKSYSWYGKECKKHEIYANTKSHSKWRPHYFYFAVPSSLEETVYNELKDSKFGLISVDNKKLESYDKVKHCTVIKRPKIINTHKEVHGKVKENIIMRMSSELINNRVRWFNTKFN